MPQGANAVPWVPHDEAALKFPSKWGENKKSSESKGNRSRKRAKNTQAAHNQRVERARVHGSEIWVSSDVGEAVAKFDVIRPSR